MKKILYFALLCQFAGAQDFFGEVVDDGIPDAHYKAAWIRTQLDPPQSWIFERDEKSILAPAIPSKNIYVPWNQIPPILYQAVISAEDGEFYKHNGLSYTGIARAAARNLMKGGVSEGGSTITQQLAKNLYGRTQRDLANKMVEASRAINLEKNLTKNQILEFYLNVFQIPGTRKGAGAAARYWFNRSLGELNPKELVFIAATLKGPALFDPFSQKDEGAKAHAAQRREDRIKWILGRMVEESYLNASQVPAIFAMPLRFAEGSVESFEVVERVRELMDSPWYQNELRSKGVSDWKKQGLRIVTTIDRNLQNQLQNAEVKHLDRLRKSFPSLEGAGVLMRWGQVWASVGGYELTGYDRAFTAKRSLGSVWKMPLYALAFKYGWELNDTLNNQISLFPYNGQLFQPKNSHKNSPSSMTVQWAAAQSENIATTQLLYRLFEKTKGNELWMDALGEFGFEIPDSNSVQSWFVRLAKEFNLKIDASSWDEVRFERAKQILVDSLSLENRPQDILTLKSTPYKIPKKYTTKYESGETWLKLAKAKDSSTQAQSVLGVFGEGIATDTVLDPTTGLKIAADIPLRLYQIYQSDTVESPWNEAKQSFYLSELRLKLALRLYQKLTQQLGLRVSGEPSPVWILGAKEENLVRNTAAMASLFRGRTYQFPDGNPWRLIQRVEDANGRVLVNPDGVEVGLFGGDVVLRMRILLQSVLRSGTASSANLSRNCNGNTALPVGGKTGTSDESKTVAFLGIADPFNQFWQAQDIWSMGFLAGNDNNTALGTGEKSLSGAGGAFPPFVDMLKVLKINKCQSIQAPNFQGDYYFLDPKTGFPTAKSKHRYWLPLPRSFE